MGGICSTGPQFVVNPNFPGQGLQTLRVAEHLGISRNQLDKLYSHFHKADSSHPGTITEGEFYGLHNFSHDWCAELAFRAPNFLDVHSKLDFQTFVITIWNICTLDSQQLARALFRYFKKNNGKLMEPEEVDTMVDTLIGHKKEKSAHAAFKALLPANSQGKHGYGDFTENQFVEVAHCSPAIMFYMFEIQRSVRLSVLGSKQWAKIASYRARVHKHAEVGEIVLNVRNVNLVLDEGKKFDEAVYRTEHKIPLHPTDPTDLQNILSHNINNNASKKPTFHGAPRPINTHAINPDDEDTNHGTGSRKGSISNTPHVGTSRAHHNNNHNNAEGLSVSNTPRVGGGGNPASGSGRSRRGSKCDDMVEESISHSINTHHHHHNNHHHRHSHENSNNVSEHEEEGRSRKSSISHTPTTLSTKHSEQHAIVGGDSTPGSASVSAATTPAHRNNNKHNRHGHHATDGHFGDGSLAASSTAASADAVYDQTLAQARALQEAEELEKLIEPSGNNDNHKHHHHRHGAHH